MADLTLRNGRTIIEDKIVDDLWIAYGFRYPVAETTAALRLVASAPMPDRALKFVTSKGVTYIWRRFVSNVDEDDDYIKPADVDSANAGRWVKTTSTASSGYLKRCELYNDDQNDLKTMETRLFGAMPAMLLSYEGRSFEPKSLGLPGFLYWAGMRFTLMVVSVNERADQTARQGSLLTAESAVDPGTGPMMGDAEHTLAGSDLGLRDVARVEILSDRPVIRDLARARFVEALDLEVFATLTNPPDETLATIETIGMQLELADLAEDGTTDPDNLLTAGMRVPIASGLNQMVEAGSARIAGIETSFIGEAHLFGANKDTYRDLLDDGTMIYVSVDNGAAAPDVTSTAMRIGITVTDGSGVVADRILCASSVTFGDVNEIT